MTPYSLWNAHITRRDIYCPVSGYGDHKGDVAVVLEMFPFKHEGFCPRQDYNSSQKRCCCNLHFSRWDNLNAMNYQVEFCLVTIRGYLLWIRMQELITPMHTVPTSQKFHDGLTRPIIISLSLNLVRPSKLKLNVERG